jgi:RNA polymerase sigma-70 factor (ECF subfamily)
MSSFQTQPEKRTKLADACAEIVADGRRRNLHGAGDADDVAQDACVRVLGRRDPRSVREPLRYLFRIARNLVIDRRRSRVREALLAESLAVIERGSGNPADPERILAGKQDLERVLAAIAALPPRCRAAFTLHRFDGLSYAAIARRMGVSTSMVEKHIAEAMVRVARATLVSEERTP